MTDKKARLEEILEAMITSGETITARAAVRQSDEVFKHPSDITRHAERRKMLEDAIERQDAIKEAAGKSPKKGRLELEEMLAAKTVEIERLRADNDLLTKSHRVMIMSVAQMGGFPVWKRFFDGSQETMDRLDAMGGIPTGEIIDLPPRKS
ncbi:hypothetical protein EHI42_02475 [Rhizobium hidalgonense]|uniref:hypothetical protein n=1 Tax=Rhizobium hidalgonense TaxID=1538159 RepID=UPI000FEC2854|nr:hypothetical protein [Rhizobium hidalgonense]RWX20058.1 hypothetical protein EHI42_02475 [Rhizobium hidalgonense]